MFFFISRAFLEFVPNLRFPDQSSSNYFKQIIKSSIQNFFKLKIRMPRDGSLQITIPSSLIKEAIKLSIKGAIGVIFALIIKELIEADKNGDFIKVLAIAAIIKAVFGTDLRSINGNDIKTFILSSLDTIDDYLDSIKSLIYPIESFEFKSIKEKLFPTIPKKEKDEKAFIEIDTEGMLNATTPLLRALQDVPFPFMVILLATSQLPGRAVMTKIYPFAAKDILPTWERMSLQNIPFVVWLDQLIATAQKSGGISSDYVAPYFTSD